jgi:hypothetical protein
MNKIENIDKQILSLKEEKKKHQEKIDGVIINGIAQTSGFKDKMLYHYDFLKHLDKKSFYFECWVELRDKSSISYKSRNGIPIGNIKQRKKDGNSPSPFWERSTHKGKPLKKVIKWYSYIRTTLEGKKTKKSIYCGGEKDIRIIIGKIYGEDTNTWKTPRLKNRVQILSIQYTRYKIYHSNLKTFFTEKHNLTKISEWVSEIGLENCNKWY